MAYSLPAAGPMSKAAVARRARPSYLPQPPSAPPPSHASAHKPGTGRCGGWAALGDGGGIARARPRRQHNREPCVVAVLRGGRVRQDDEVLPPSPRHSALLLHLHASPGGGRGS